MYEMNWAVQRAARLARAALTVWERKWSFLSLGVLVFVVSAATLAYFDLLPEHASVEAAALVEEHFTEATTLVEASFAEAPEAPIAITIRSIGLEAQIENPTSTSIAILDEALLTGAVRYPTSAQLGERGNVVLFGHSSYLPIVHNQAFKTFDGIQNLKKGDEIIVTSATRSYVYAVTSVAKADADSAAIALDVSGRILTLATCDSFGTKSDRFIVTAEFVKSEQNHQ